MTNSAGFPENYKELITNYLRKKYGDRFSLRSTIIFPPVSQKESVGGREVISFRGKVRFNVIDRRTEDFGLHQMIYVIKDNQATLLNRKEES